MRSQIVRRYDSYIDLVKKLRDAEAAVNRMQIWAKEARHRGEWTDDMDIILSLFDKDAQTVRLAIMEALAGMRFAVYPANRKLEKKKK